MKINLGIIALIVYVVGGVLTFGGIAIILLIGKDQISTWGTGTALGLVALCVGVAVSIMGVLMMRIFHNRFPMKKDD
ncbi:MAG: hypothetical protein C0622_14500 [Desulfuromonas sp.]|nr:MAG: hypothetical protein C0622_14500 [Desulfuromonas sp.]